MTNIPSSNLTSLMLAYTEGYPKEFAQRDERDGNIGRSRNISSRKAGNLKTALTIAKRFRVVMGISVVTSIMELRVYWDQPLQAPPLDSFPVADIDPNMNLIAENEVFDLSQQWDRMDPHADYPMASMTGGTPLSAKIHMSSSFDHSHVPTKQIPNKIPTSPRVVASDSHPEAYHTTTPTTHGDVPMSGSKRSKPSHSYKDFRNLGPVPDYLIPFLVRGLAQDPSLVHPILHHKDHHRIFALSSLGLLLEFIYSTTYKCYMDDKQREEHHTLWRECKQYNLCPQWLSSAVDKAFSINLEASKLKTLEDSSSADWKIIQIIQDEIQTKQKELEEAKVRLSQTSTEIESIKAKINLPLF
ncbi:hypothetical protein FNV43_RR25934 [Rhamnella rubrinervis]|uniref:Uncharacterized protein n=1 Tax=Rhamnella rubrinervis TaxID=2594499 RepID=A0A8K0DN35_9ROSA|nr:hypothetical protein FNV43_RR25934 [Rhamnella rubrinervis]